MSNHEYLPDHRDDGPDVPTSERDLPPNAFEAEQGVLACILLDPRECIGECVQAFKAGKAVFYHLPHQVLYETLVAMWDANDPIDTVTLTERMKTERTLEQIGGISALAALPDKVPSAANLAEYVEIVLEKWTLRALQHVLGHALKRSRQHTGEVRELLNETEAAVLAVGESRVQAEYRDMKTLVGGAITAIEEMHRGVGLLRGLRTHFGYFDKKTGGLQASDMIVIAGRPSTGKTSLAMNMAANIAILERIPVGIFSLEMTADALTLRLMCAEGSINGTHLRDGFLSQDDFTRLSKATKVVAAAPIHIDDTPGLSILDLRARARRMKKRFGCRLFVIDYIQLMHSDSPKAQTREREVADISAGCKGIAKELRVPVIALSQLNRESAKSRNRKPQLDDLRESGAIEQDADVVGLLYQPKTDGDEDVGYQDTIPVNLCIAKQRNGPTCDVEFTFKKAFTKFLDAYNNRGKEGPTADDIPRR